MDACRQPESAPNCLQCLKLTNREQELHLENTMLNHRIQKMETRLLAHENTTKLLMSTFEILQKREREINELKSKVSLLEKNEVLITLRSKLQYVQSLNLRLQEELYSKSSLESQLDESKQEIQRLTHLLSGKRRVTSPVYKEEMPMKGVRRNIPAHNLLQSPDLSSMPPVQGTSYLDMSLNTSEGDSILLLSDSDLTIFSDEMAGLLGSLS